MIEVDLPVPPIHLDQLFPVVRLVRRLIVLNQLELVREPPPQDQLISSIGIETSYFASHQSLVVFKDCNPLNHSIYLTAVRIEIDFAELVKDCFLSIWAEIQELVLVDKELWGPGWRHIEHFFIFFRSVFILFLLFMTFIALFILSALFLSLLNHHVLPFTCLVVSKVKVDFIKGSSYIEIDPEVLMIEDGFH
jgi:hypothetical protein